MTMAPCAIVKDFDVIKDVSTRQVTGFVDAFADPLLLETAKERLCHSIIPAIAAATHAGFKVIGQTESAPIVAAILTALVRMDEYRTFGFASPQRHE